MLIDISSHHHFLLQSELRSKSAPHETNYNSRWSVSYQHSFWVIPMGRLVAFS